MSDPIFRKLFNDICPGETFEFNRNNVSTFCEEGSEYYFVNKTARKIELFWKLATVEGTNYAILGLHCYKYGNSPSNVSTKILAPFFFDITKKTVIVIENGDDDRYITLIDKNLSEDDVSKNSLEWPFLGNRVILPTNCRMI